MEEKWKSIPGWPGYEVSDWGNVHSYKRRVKGRGRWVIDESPQRVLKASLDRENGYRRVILCHNGKPKLCTVARLVLLAFVGPCPEGMEACHTDCNSENDRLDNLRYDTHINNSYDGVGSHAKTRLTNKRAVVVKQLAADGLSDEELASMFGVSVSTIANCRLGHRYSYTSGPLTNRTRRLKDSEIRQMREDGQSKEVFIVTLAEQYGVDVSYVSLVLRGLRRKKAGGPIATSRYMGAKSAV